MAGAGWEVLPPHDLAGFLCMLQPLYCAPCCSERNCPKALPQAATAGGSAACLLWQLNKRVPCSHRMQQHLDKEGALLSAESALEGAAKASTTSLSLCPVACRGGFEYICKRQQLSQHPCRSGLQKTPGCFHQDFCLHGWPRLGVCRLPKQPGRKASSSSVHDKSPLA